MTRTHKIKFSGSECKPGVERAEWHGGPFTVIRYVYQPGAVFPSHSHDSDQITVVLQGNIEFESEGERFALAPGESIFIPGNAPHSAVVPADSDPVVSINVFHPPRKEHP